jgi:GT2 family glycosyltransferase
MSASAAPAVAVAVLTWNDRALLERCLRSVACQDYEDFRTIVVDNGSTDGTVAALHRTWPDVEVVALPENIGITAGINRCVETAAGADLIALLNNDVELDPRWLSELVTTLTAEPQAASASGKVLRLNAPEVIDRTGDVMAWDGEAIGRGGGELDQGQYDFPGSVFAACGGMGLFRAAAFHDVGLFDADFFAYHDDTDWGFRARLAGWTSIYTPSAVAWHVGGASFGHESQFALYHGMRNAVWLIAKNYPRQSLVRHAPDLLRRHAMLVLSVTRDGRLGVLARAWRDAARGLPLILAKRREVQRRAAVEPSALETALVKRLA